MRSRILFLMLEKRYVLTLFLDSLTFDVSEQGNHESPGAAAACIRDIRASGGRPGELAVRYEKRLGSL
jgi:hypothetical protein